jgi:hypothetical protein
MLASTTPAFAHSPIMGIGGVLGGILHALLIPEHGLSLLALGLALGQQEQSARRAGILIYVGALTCGLVAAALAAGEALAADVLLAATGILGLLVVTMWTPTYPVWVLAAIARGPRSPRTRRPCGCSSAGALAPRFRLRS